MKHLGLPLWIALCTVLTCMPVHALEPLVLYDDFQSSQFIDVNKWAGYEPSVPLDSPREIIRAIDGSADGPKRLQLMTRGGGAIDPKLAGTQVSTGPRLKFIHSEAVTAIRSEVTVTNYQLDSCRDGTPSKVQARIGGVYFNSGKVNGDDQTNDVVAYLQVQRQTTDTLDKNHLNVSALVMQCRDSACGNVTVLGSPSLGTVAVGQKVALTLVWDKEHHRFSVKRDNQKSIFIPYTLSDTSPGHTTSKRLQVSYFAANCSSGSPPVAYMNAFFDNVYVNQSALAVAGSPYASPDAEQTGPDD